MVQPFAATPTRMRVLNCLHRSHPGGAHWRILWVREELLSEGVDTIPLFPSDEDAAFAEHLDAAHVPYVRTRLPSISRRAWDNVAFIAGLPASVSAIRRTIARERIDVVHVNGVTNLQPVFAALAERVPVVWHFNDMQTPAPFVRLIAPLLRRSDVKLLVATEAILDRYGLRASLHEEQWIRMPAPLPPRGERTGEPIERRNLGIPESSTVLGFVGNLHRIKGVHDFLSVAMRHLRDDPASHAVIVGPTVPTQASYAASLRSTVEASGVSDRIHFVGFQSNVVSWLEMFDVFVFPSYSEACPIVMLEAMEAGVPPVATHVGEVPAMLRGTGSPLVEPGDVGALLRGVRDRLDLGSDDRESLREALRTRVRTEYSLASVAHKHLDVYRAQVGATGRPIP